MASLQSRELWCSGPWLPEPSSITNCSSHTVSTSLLACLGTRTPTGIPGARISYPTTSSSVGTYENYAGGGTCSSSEASIGISASTSLFSKRGTTIAISWTISNSRLILSRDLCWSSLARSCSSLRACCSSRNTLIRCLCGVRHQLLYGWGGSPDKCRRLHCSGGLPLRGLFAIRTAQLLNTKLTIDGFGNQLIISQTNGLDSIKWINRKVK